MKIRFSYILIIILATLQFSLYSLDITPDSLPVLLEKIDEKYEIDRHAAYIATDFGGAYYDEEINAVIPVNPETIHEEWQKSKNLIAQEIGQINPPVSEETELWKNSAQTVDELYRDAQKASAHFRNNCEMIAKHTNSKCSFGLGNANIIKSKESLNRKVLSLSEYTGISVEEAVAQVSDALRGTIIAKTHHDIPKIAKEIQIATEASGGQAAFLNYWEYERDSGYIGIHAKLYLPVLDNTTGEEKFILVELQIHLACIMDGTLECVKERAHLLYEKAKRNGNQAYEILSASKLLYLTAIRRCETCVD